MHVISELPIVLGLFATIMTAISETTGNLLKLIVAAVYVSSVCMQFVPWLSESVHFIIPLFMQIGLCLWYLFVGKNVD